MLEVDPAAFAPLGTAAVIVAVPSFFAVTNPLLLTVATLSSLVLQVIPELLAPVGSSVK